ncbi:MAG TPA: amidophosphoribosyltransferase [Spirochaetia bacterium]|nr:amidophosphoribosyltransferase [Spirochaetia bacterium]
MTDEKHEECGIAGIYNHEKAARLLYLSLYAQQHRGQESAGIVTTDGQKMRKCLGLGKVMDFFSEEKLAELTGSQGIGHVRYSTTGFTKTMNIQPMVVGYHDGMLSTAHNGNLTNARKIRQKLEEKGHIFQTSMDSEILVHLIALSREESFLDKTIDALKKIEGAWSFLLMNHNSIIAARDPHGFRPLVMGKIGNAVVFASETCALDMIDAEFVREIEPGELVQVNQMGVQSCFPFPKKKSQQCIFEFIYFAKPSSSVFGKSVYSVRSQIGRIMAREMPAIADCIVPVPDSGTTAALGYAEASGIPFVMGLIRSHYIGRTFIQPTQDMRTMNVKLKFSVVREILHGKKIVLIDDSIVRGTTSRTIINVLRQAGVKEIHFRISCPPIISPCYFGVDFADREQLIACKYEQDLSRMAEFLGVDSLSFISLEGLLSACQGVENKFCLSCFTGKYLVPVTDKVDKQAFELNIP